MNAIDLKGTEGNWTYKTCTVNVGDPDLNARCQLCRAPMRFSHALFYPTELGRIRGATYNHIYVGVDCATKLLVADEYEIPRLAENETKRKENWRIRYKNYGVCRTTIDNLIDRGIL